MALHYIEPFIFKTFPVLPTQFDDSLSYYEAVNKVVIKLNEGLAAINSQNDQLTEWHTQIYTDIGEWEQDVLDALNSWKNDTEDDITQWKNDTLTDFNQWLSETLASLNEWKEARDEEYDELAQRTEEAIEIAENSATAAASSATSASDSATSASNSATEAANSAESVAAEAAQIATNTTDISDLKTQLNFQIDDNFWSYGTITKGYAIRNTITGEDLVINTDYWTTDYIPVTPGDIVFGTGSRFKTYDSNKTPLYTNIFQNLPTVLQDNIHYFVIPDGVSFFRVCREVIYTKFIAKVNPYEYWLKNQIESITSEVSDISQSTDKIALLEPYNLWAVGRYSENTLIRSSGATVGNNPDYDTTDFIPVTPGEIIYGKGARFCCFESDKTTVVSSAVLDNQPNEIGYNNHYYVIPDNTAFFRLCIYKPTTEKLLFKVNPYEYWLNNKIDNFDIADIEERIENLENPPKTKTLYAIGDSITRGMYAEYGASASSGPTSLNYVRWLGEIKHFNVVNLGESGAGYALKGTQTNSNGKDIVDNNTFENADIVTIALGINDYKHNPQSPTIISLGDMSSQSGDGTVIGNMKYMIENIYNKAPTANIVIILPMNQNRFGYNDMSFADNWSFGYAFRENKTLADYRNAIKECADYYNLTVIDEEFVTPINRYNIRYCLGDGLHPTKAFYKRMAEAFAPFIE